MALGHELEAMFCMAYNTTTELFLSVDFIFVTAFGYFDFPTANESLWFLLAPVNLKSKTMYQQGHRRYARCTFFILQLTLTDLNTFENFFAENILKFSSNFI